eukprot:m51a1_g12080 putative serine threonine kinase (479) ;mRNA; f:391-2975
MIQMFSKYGITRIAGIGNNDSYGQGGLQKLVTYAGCATPSIEVVATIYYPPVVTDPAEITNNTIVMGMSTAVDHTPVTDNFTTNMTRYMKYDKLLSPYYTSFQYDATLAWIYAVKKILAAGQDPYNRSLLYSTLMALDFIGATGEISFDDNGDRFATIAIARFVSGNENLEIIGNWTVGKGVLIDEAHAPWSLSSLKSSERRNSGLYVVAGVMGGVALLVIAGAVAGSFMWHQQKVQRALMLKEVFIMKSLRHPSLLLFMCYAMTEDSLIIVTEFMPHGSLLDLLSDKSMPINTFLKLRILNDVAAGMAYLHGSNPPIIHRDLKSSNILSDQSVPGTLLWTAPEIINHGVFSTKSDVYAFGIMLWEMVTRELPFRDMNSLMKEALYQHHHAIRSALYRNNGYEVKTQGDAFMITFQAAIDALRFCVDAQLALVNLNWNPELLEFSSCNCIMNGIVFGSEATLMGCMFFSYCFAYFMCR